jgi:hypothetical protein
MRKTLLILAAVASPLAAQDAPGLFDSTRTAPLSPGQWSYAATATGSEARFGATFSIRCDRTTRRVTLRRTDSLATPASALTIGTDLAINIIAAGGVVGANDAVLDAIAFSRGRFIVTGGGPQLVLPASPEAARSIEDCRN